MSLDDLKKQIANKKAILFIGTGVSISASNNSPIADWKGLLRNGVDRCVDLCRPLPPDWKARMLVTLAPDFSDMVELLSTAEQIYTRLTALGAGQYSRWLRETIGQLSLPNLDDPPEIMKAIKALNLPIITTNYDDLLEQGLGLRTIAWTDSSEVDRFLRGDEKGIFHLHGHWRTPNSIILGIRNYQNITNFPLVQSFMQALRLDRNLVFIGFGAGLQDPNFKAFLDFGSSVLSQSESRHYRFIKEDELASFHTLHPNGSGIFPISYGSSYTDLPHFIRSLNAIPNF